VLEEDRFGKDPIVGTSLISMYGKCGNLESARRSFEDIGQRTTICGTAMMAAYVDNNRADDAVGLFCLMDEEGLHPTNVTFVVALDACADSSNLFVGEALVRRIEIVSGCMNDVKIGTALVNMFGRCGNVEEARHVFDQISMVLNLGSWNAMVATYSHHGQSKNSFDLFEQLKSHGMKPNIVTYVSVLSVCSHEGLVYDACHVFSSMSQYNIDPVEHHYNCIVDLLARVGRLDEAEILVDDIVNSTSFVPVMTLLAACKNQIDVRRGVRMANLLFQLGVKEEDPSLVFSSIRAASRVQAADMAFNRGCINVDQLLV
jgi:pentatricopeptide repeat protein